MANVFEQGLRRAAYGAGTTAKVGWYSLFYMMGRHIVGPLTKPGEVPRPTQSGRTSLRQMRAEFGQLFRDEWADIEAGVYKLPKEYRDRPKPLQRLRDARSYLEEARAVAKRAHRSGGGTEVREGAPDDLPAYYKQNFHFQTDGWLSDRSAQVYDTQVEVLFTGSAGAMRRRALPLIADEINRLAADGTALSEVHLADIGCGTGGLLGDIVDNYPKLKVSAVDLSAPYLARARKSLGRNNNIEFIEAAAEKLPFEDGSIDILTSVYLFHELPPKVRCEVAAEFARVLKPGGLYVHLDSVQYGDTSMDVLLETFPRAFHEPYYDSYCREDLGQLFGQAGLAAYGSRLGFLSKARSFRKARGA